MRALHLDANEGRLEERRDYPIPPLVRGDDALIRVLRAGICNTDLEMMEAYKPGFSGVLGHEFVGRVAEVGANVREPTKWLGRRVCGEINLVGCGSDAAEWCTPCALVRDGRADSRLAKSHCRRRRVMGIWNHDGALAEYAVLPVGNLHLVPEALSDEEACSVEPLAAAYRILDQIDRERDLNVAVVGDGKLGLLVSQVMLTTAREEEEMAAEGETTTTTTTTSRGKRTKGDENRRVTLFGHHSDRMQTFRVLLEGKKRERLVCVVSTTTSVKGEGTFDVVVECTGRRESLESMALKLVRPMGKVILKTTCSSSSSRHHHNESPSLSLEAANDAVVREISIIGSRCGDFEKAISALRLGHVRVFPEMIRTVRVGEDGEDGEGATLLDAVRVAKDKGNVTMKIQVAFFM